MGWLVVVFCEGTDGKGAVGPVGAGLARSVLSVRARRGTRCFVVLAGAESNASRVVA